MDGSALVHLLAAALISQTVIFFITVVNLITHADVIGIFVRLCNFFVRKVKITNKRNDFDYR
jgi:hypothetical protein